MWPGRKTGHFKHTTGLRTFEVHEDCQCFSYEDRQYRAEEARLLVCHELREGAAVSWAAEARCTWSELGGHGTDHA